MRILRRFGPALAISVWVGLLLGAHRQQPRPPRPLGPIVARAPMTFGSISRVFVLRGSLFLNDPKSRQVVMLDSTLGRARVVLDSISGAANEYPGIGAPFALHRFRGDSAFIAPQGWPTLTVIGPDGTIGRTIPMPRHMCTYIDMDNTGRATCAIPPPNPQALIAQRRPAVVAHDTTMVLVQAESTTVIAVDFDTDHVDTLARVSVSTAAYEVTYLANGRTSGGHPIELPVVVQDAWAVLRDGTLAIVRATGYRMELVDRRGVHSVGPPVAYQWRPVTEPDRQRLIDSMKKENEADRTRLLARADSLLRARGGATGYQFGPGPGIAPAERWPTLWPAFVKQFPNADEEDRLWIQETLPPPADTVKVFAVLDRHGVLVDRIQIAKDQTIVGFGPGGAVFLTSVVGGRTTLVKARFR